MPLTRRIPKRGFHNRFADRILAINVGDLDKKFEAGEEVTPELLQQRELIKRNFDRLKILGDGELTKPLKVAAHQFSVTAKQKIEQAGGQAILLPGKAPVPKNKSKPKKPRAAATRI